MKFAEPWLCFACRVVWWVDPVGAILISCYIVWSWIGIAREQMNQMVRSRRSSAPGTAADSL